MTWVCWLGLLRVKDSISLGTFIQTLGVPACVYLRTGFWVYESAIVDVGDWLATILGSFEVLCLVFCSEFEFMRLYELVLHKLSWFLVIWLIANLHHKSTLWTNTVSILWSTFKNSQNKWWIVILTLRLLYRLNKQALEVLVVGLGIEMTDIYQTEWQRRYRCLISVRLKCRALPSGAPKLTLRATEASLHERIGEFQHRDVQQSAAQCSCTLRDTVATAAVGLWETIQTGLNGAFNCSS